MKRLVELGAEVNIVTSNGCFPLCVASGGGYNETLEFSIEKGLDVNQYCKNSGCTPVLGAARRGYEETVKLLMKHGADIHKLELKDNGSMLTLVAESQYCGSGFIKYLLEQKMDVNHANNSGRTALHIIISSGGDVDNMKLLIEKGANVNAADKDGMTPLHLAVKSNSRDFVELLMKNRANINAVANVTEHKKEDEENKDGKKEAETAKKEEKYEKMTPLYLAIKSKKVSSMIKLLADNADFELNFNLAKENQDEEMLRQLESYQPPSIRSLFQSSN